MPVLNSPRLAGLPEGYLLRQMQAFATGARASAVMAPIARALSHTQQAQVTGLYARMQSPATGSPAGADAAELAAGAQLALRGRWQQELPACTQCHGAGGSGVGDWFPALAGQPAGYLRAQLMAWQSGTRPAGPLGLMGPIAAKLSRDDIRAVAAWFSAPGTAPRDAQPGAGSHGPAEAQTEAASSTASFAPPPDSRIPNDGFGEVVRLGEHIFDETGIYAAGYAGNALRCSSCHLDRGRRANSAPLWGAYVAYPAYRAKNGHVNTYAERLQGCFQYSMNGKAPPLGSPILVALETYSYWLASGARIDPHLAGRGYPPVPRAALPPDFQRGQRVYSQHCALCHGPQGAGQNAGNGAMAFPALWGDGSFNWGAGMADVNNAAAFIRANMPLSQDHTLTDQQAWDVALFMDSHERPQDPRYRDSVQLTRQRFHDTGNSMYGRRVNGHVLGEGSTAPGGSLRAFNGIHGAHD
jgi:thiosulfate dehydrogenase